jgi:hypothetical protein
LGHFFNGGKEQVDEDHGLNGFTRVIQDGSNHHVGRLRSIRQLMSKQNAQPENTDPRPLQETLQQLLEQIVRRNQKISWINAEKTAAARSFSEQEQDLLNKISEKEAILFYTQAQLTEREAQLNEILTSNTWKMALFLQRLRTFLVPPQSRRARLLQRGLEILLSPFRKPGRN